MVSQFNSTGLCEDHFPEDCFTATKNLKLIPFNKVTASNKNIQNENKEE